MAEEEVKQEEVLNEVSENTQEIEQTSQETEQKEEVVAEKPSKKDKEHNFAELRKKAEAAERALDLERQRNQEMMELLKQNRQPQQNQRDPEEEELEKLSQEDLLTVKDARKLNKHHTKGLQSEVQKLKGELEELRLRTKYPDLDEVLSAENIELLKKDDPEIAAMIGGIGDPQKQATMAYKYIKKMMPAKQPEPEDRKRAIENGKKPMSIQAVSKTSPIGMANAFTTMNPSKDEKAAIWKQMQEDMKRG